MISFSYDLDVRNAWLYVMLNRKRKRSKPPVRVNQNVFRAGESRSEAARGNVSFGGPPLARIIRAGGGGGGGGVVLRLAKYEFLYILSTCTFKLPSHQLYNTILNRRAGLPRYIAVT